MSEAVDFDPFAQPAIVASAPTTQAQREVSAGAQLGDDANCAFNESITVELRGPVDTMALGVAWRALGQSHDALRATISPDGKQLLVVERDLTLPVEDLRGAAAPDDEVRARAGRAVRTPFDLVHGPLIEGRFCQVADDRGCLLITAHHVVCDGWSMGVLLRDLAALYRAALEGEAAPLSRPSFCDYAQKEHDAAGPAEAAAAAYWEQALTGPLPVLDLPTDRPRPTMKTYASRRIDLPLPADVLERLRAFGAPRRASLSTMMLVAVQTWLGRLARARDVIVGVPAAGQAAAGQTDLVGHCVSMLPLRAEVEDTRPVTEVIEQVRTAVLDGFENQSLTWGALLQRLPIERDPGRLPLISATFNLDPDADGGDLDFGPASARVWSNPRAFETFELFLNAAKARGETVLEVQYNVDLFDEQTVRAWLDGLVELLRQLPTEGTGALGDVGWVSPGQRAALLAENDTARDGPRDEPVHRAIERQAAATPDAPAATDRGRTLSYAQLDTASNRLARRLREGGAGPGEKVGILLERDVDLVVAVHAVLKSGAAYVPLHTGWPVERLTRVLDDAGVETVLSKAKVWPGDEGVGRSPVWVDDPAGETLSGAPLVGVDPGRDAGPSDLAYVIYTSGSTGRPKGVEIEHRAITNLLETLPDLPGISAADVMVAVTPPSFDISLGDLVLPFRVGAHVVLAHEDDVADGLALVDLLEDHDPTVMQATPALLRALVGEGWAGSARLRVWSCGEALPEDLARVLVPKVAELWNLYGPTEATVYATCARVEADVNPVSIGRPLPNYTCHIVDPAGRLVPPGVVGELGLGGPGLARGYLNRPALTAERFVTGPDGARMYRTGDLARRLPDGRLFCLGRLDDQVKVRGHRIELGEIESVLRGVPGVHEVVAVLLGQDPADVRLAAYAQPAPGHVLSADALRERARAELPAYAVPQHVVVVEAFPRNYSGKLDKRALPDPRAAAAAAAGFVDPASPLERVVAEVWSDVLGLSRVSARANFFDLGGHSLLAIEAIAQLEERTGVRLNPRVVLRNSLSQVAKLLEGAA